MYVRFAVAMAILLPGILAAQPPRGRYDGPPGRGRFEMITRTINDCERRTNEFRDTLRRALEHSRVRDSNREDELNRDGARLERSLNRVGDSWNGEHNPGKTRHFVDTAIGAGQDINRTMVRRRLNPEVQRQWDIVRAELNRLAEVFELPRIRW